MLIQVVVESLEFSPLERKIYDSLYSDAKRRFEKLSEKGVVSKNYTSILAMLMGFVVPLKLTLTVPNVFFYPSRLRRAVLHPSLVLKDPEDATKFTADQAFVDVQNMVRSYIDLTEADNGSGSNDKSTPNGDAPLNTQNAISSTYAQDVLTSLDQAEEAECPICMDVMQSPVLIPQCLHQG